MNVYVYRNLNRKGVVWSVKDRKTGLVIDRSPTVYVRDAEFRVSQKGRERVLREQRKNVHAGVAGKRRSRAPRGNWVRVTYNPYKAGSFLTQDGTPITSASWVKLTPTGCYALIT